MSRKTVLLDVDGVIADFHTPALALVEQFSGMRWHRDQMRTWDVFGTVGSEHQQEIEVHWGRPQWCLQIPEYEGAVDAVRRIHEVAEVVFVTAPMPNNPYWMHERDQWLRRRFGEDSQIIFATQKRHVVGDVFVDDKVANVRRWCEAHPTKTGLLWDQPYNRDADDLRRVHTWDQVLSLLP